MRAFDRRNPLSIVLTALLLISIATAADTLTPTNPLTGSQTLISSGGVFALGFFTPPNTKNRYLGIWYNKIPVQTIVWVANRQNPLITEDSAGSTLSIADNGSLVIANRNSTAAVWSTVGTASITSPVAQLLDSGNFLVKAPSSSNTFLWQSFDHPTDTLVPGMKLGIDFARGLNTNLTSWKSYNDPSPGDFYTAMVATGDPEMLLWAGPNKVYRTGPWEGTQLSGIPESTSYQYFTFTFINNKDEITYSYQVSNATVVSRLVANESGRAMQRSLWIEEAGAWNIFWYAPKDQCDIYGTCGPNGVCNPNNSPICDCLQGFTPRYPANWALRDGSGGCVRKTAVDCRNGTDGFAKLGSAKLPDTTNSTVDMSLSLDECRALCLNNCSCTACASASVIGGGSGCVVWSSELTDLRVYTDGGQDLYIRLAAADVGSITPSQHDDNSQETTTIIIVSVVLGVLLLFLGYLFWRRRRIRRKRGILSTTSFTYHYNDESSQANDRELPVFDLETISSAVDDFSISNKLGQGGFGPVYKGRLRDGQEIAVKRLAKTSIQGLDEFKNEVMLIAKLQHRNLVRLLGYCTQGKERMLIYEYMPNRSLDAFIFDKERAALLDWQTRYKIISGIARGLLYLHQDSRFRIIHRDLKAGNILLDKEMNPKISDFGMARIFGGDEIEGSTRKVVGTYGYMSPEYAMDGIFSVKSDVYSFGVLVLEIISSKKNRGALSWPNLNLVGHAWKLWSEGKTLQLADESMGGSFPTDEVLKCIRIGLLCVQERPEDRPLMSSLVLMLGSVEGSIPRPKEPGFVTKRVPFETESSSSKQESCASNDMTFTMIEGR